MIDAKRLEGLCCSHGIAADDGWVVEGYAAPLSESDCKELLDLARLGIWARDYAAHAIMKTLPMVHGCSASGDHDDPTWCTERCGDYGRTLRKAIQAFPKEVRGE